VRLDDQPNPSPVGFPRHIVRPEVDADGIVNPKDTTYTKTAGRVNLAHHEWQKGWSLQEANAKQDTEGDLLSPRKLCFPEENGRHAAGNEVLDQAHDSGADEVVAFVEAVELSGIQSRPLQVGFHPEGPERSASQVQVEGKDDPVDGDKGNGSIHGPEEAL